MSNQVQPSTSSALSNSSSPTVEYKDNSSRPVERATSVTETTTAPTSSWSVWDYVPTSYIPGSGDWTANRIKSSISEVAKDDTPLGAVADAMLGNGKRLSKLSNTVINDGLNALAARIPVLAPLIAEQAASAAPPSSNSLSVVSSSTSSVSVSSSASAIASSSISAVASSSASPLANFGQTLGSSVMSGALRSARNMLPAFIRPFLGEEAPQQAEAPNPANTTLLSLDTLLGILRDPNTGFGVAGVRFIKSTLESLKGNVESQRQEAERIVNDQSVQASQRDIQRQAQTTAQATITDIDACIGIANTTLQNYGQNNNNLSTALTQISTIMQRHPLSLPPLGEIPLPIMAQEADENQTITTILNQLRVLQQSHHPEIQDDFNFAAGIETEWQNLREISTYKAVHAGITYFLGTTTERTSFQTMMARIEEEMGAVRNPTERRRLFISTLRREIRGCGEIFFLKRWILQIFLPFIIWACELTTDRLVNGMKNHLSTNMPNGRSSITGISSEVPLTLLSQVANGVRQGDINHATGDTSTHRSRAECREQYLNGPRFLRGHANMQALALRFGDVAVETLLAEFHSISNICNKLSTWLRNLSSSNYLVVEIFFSLFTIPIRTAIWILKVLIAHPVEWVSNKLIKRIFKTILKRTKFVESITNLTRDTLFGNGQTEVIDTLIIDLLRRVGTQLDSAPSSRSSLPETQASGEVRNLPMEECLHSLLESLLCARMSPQDLQRHIEGRSSWRQQITQSIGSYAANKVIRAISSLAEQSYASMTTPEMMNRHLYLALKTSRTSLLAQAATQNDQQSRDRDHRARRTMIRHLINIVISKVANKATQEMANPRDPDTPIRQNIEWLRSTFLPPQNSATSTAQGLIANWRREAQLICDSTTDRTRALATLDLVSSELRDVYTNMQERLLLIEPQVGSQSLAAHNRDLNAILTTLGTFQTEYLAVDYHFRRHILPEGVETSISTLNTRLTNLSTNLNTAAEQIRSGTPEWLDETRLRELLSSVEQIEQLGGEILTLVGGGNQLPGDLREYLNTLRDDIAAFRRQIGALQKYTLFTRLIQQMRDTTNANNLLSTALTVNGNRNFSLYRNSTLQPHLSELAPADHQAIVRALDALEATLSNNRGVALETFFGTLTSISQNAFTTISESTNSTNRRITHIGELAHSHITSIQQARTANRQEFLRQKQTAINAALDGLGQQMQNLSQISSIQLPLVTRYLPIGWIKGVLRGQLSDLVSDFLESYRDPSVFGALTSRPLIHFLETNGVRLQENLTSPVAPIPDQRQRAN